MVARIGNNGALGAYGAPGYQVVEGFGKLGYVFLFFCRQAYNGLAGGLQQGGGSAGGCMVYLVAYQQVAAACGLQVGYLLMQVGHFGGRCGCGRCIEQVNDNIGPVHGIAAAGYAFLFYHIGSVGAYAGRVYYAKKDAPNIEQFFNCIARGTGYGRYNGAFFVQQGIQQGAFACIGFACYGYAYAIAYGIAQLKRLHQCLCGLGNVLYELVETGAVGKLYVFLTEIELEFYECGKLYKLFAHVGQIGTEAATQVVHGRTVGGAAVAGYEVGHGFGLREVEPAGKECPHGELAGLGHTGTVGYAEGYYLL